MPQTWLIFALLLTVTMHFWASLQLLPTVSLRSFNGIQALVSSDTRDITATDMLDRQLMSLFQWQNWEKGSWHFAEDLGMRKSLGWENLNFQNPRSPPDLYFLPSILIQVVIAQWIGIINITRSKVFKRHYRQGIPIPHVLSPNLSSLTLYYLSV